MNTNEIDRIAAAANALRPDWPVASLRTLLSRPELANRPRRDVALALVWVACDSTTVTPARVLEAGPWWRATLVDGSSRGGIKRAEACGVCGRRAGDHVGPILGDHDFEPVGLAAARAVPAPQEDL